MRKNIDVKPLKLYHVPFMLDLNLIDPEVFATEKQVLEGTVKLGELDERVWSHEYLADKDADVSFVLKGGSDKWQRLFLDLSLKAEIPLICQRCVKPLSFELDETSRIVLFADEQSLDEAMLSDDELEGMLLEKELDILALIEDQILMAMPYSPRHENCHNIELETVNHDKPNPFAALAGLKSSR